MISRNTYLRIFSFGAVIFELILLVCCVSPTNREIITRHFDAEQKSPLAAVKISVDYPVSGPQKAIKNIQKDILKNLQAKTTDNSTDLTQILNDNSKQKHKFIAKQNSSDDSIHYQAELSEIVAQKAETDNFITFVYQSYSYDGGAHGSTATKMLTYRKTDGKKINSDILVPNLPADFKQLLAQGLKAYFSSFGENVEIFGEFNLNNLPLPQSEPFLTEQGVGFCYAQYEIAPYSSGQPAFIIPYHLIKPYLSKETLKLIPVYDQNASVLPYNVSLKTL
ncbi:MAG: DUF4163 domain-containing protein [Alphaproteobacteria bacterium]|nr:DUF4163 domain-containing protein [Alphaproteobacteria bacterium]